MCALAWNVEVMEHHDKHAKPALRGIGDNALAAVDRIGATAVIDELRERKRLLFPDDQRLIVDASLEPMEDDTRYLTIASTDIRNSRTTQPRETDHGAPLLSPCGGLADTQNEPGRYSTRTERPTIAAMRTSSRLPSASIRRRSSPGTKWTGCGCPSLMATFDA